MNWQGRNAAKEMNPDRERILQIAAKLFARNGYDATGIAELCKAAQMGRGALYHHIESKESLLFEISMRLLVTMAERAEQLAATEAPPQEKLRSLGRMLLRLIADNRTHATVTFRDSRALTQARYTAFGNQRRRVEAVWQRLLEEGQAAGVFRAVDPVVMKGLWGMHAFSHRWIDIDGPLTPEEIADAFCDVVLAGVAAREG